MDSEDETPFDEVDSGNESSGDDVDFAMEVDSNTTKERPPDVDDYPFEVLTTEEIVQHMIDCIKEVNMVVEVRMLRMWKEVINNKDLNQFLNLRTLDQCQSNDLDFAELWKTFGNF